MRRFVIYHIDSDELVSKTLFPSYAAAAETVELDDCLVLPIEIPGNSPRVYPAEESEEDDDSSASIV